MDPIAYDLVVIGSGPAGENGAATAASFGKRVAMVEKSPLVGGAPRRTPGTLPSKTLRETALAISGLRGARPLRRGPVAPPRGDGRRLHVPRAAGHGQRAAAGRARAGRAGSCSTTAPPRSSTRTRCASSPMGAEPGTSPAAPRSCCRGETILIATGSSPVRPPGFPFEHDRVHDSDEVLQLERLPAVDGRRRRGVIGCEYACTFAALGTKVWIIDGRDELLPFLDQEVSEALEEAMRRQLGIEFLWKRKVTGCEAPTRGGHRA